VKRGSAAPPLALPFSLAERAVNKLLQADPEGAAGLDAIEGRTLGIKVDQLEITVCCHFEQRRVSLSDSALEAADAVIEGAPAALLRMLGDAVRGREMVDAQIRIHGDVEFVQVLKRALSGLEVDFEEQLAGVVGDPLARATSVAVAGIDQWFRRSQQTFFLNLGEYLEHETELLVNRREVDEFASMVDETRDDVERLEQRVARLQSSRPRTWKC